MAEEENAPVVETPAPVAPAAEVPAPETKHEGLAAEPTARETAPTVEASESTDFRARREKRALSSTQRDSSTVLPMAEARDGSAEKPHAKKTAKAAERLMALVDDEEFDSGESEGSEEMGEEESESSVSVGSYIQQKELEKEEDFFEVLGQIPSVGSISLDPSVQLEMTPVVPQEPVKTGIDAGKFTDPLTGKVIVSEVTLETVSRSSKARSTIGEVEEEEEEGEVEEEEEDFDLILPPEIVFEEEKPLPKEDDGLDLWYTMETPQIKRDTEIDLEEMLRAAHREAMLIDTRNFLDALIDSTVDKCEYIDPNTILRQNLDKRKLVQELQNRLIDLEVEQKARFFLNRKTVEYFRRKKAFRALHEDSPETITQVIEKYKEATNTLDQLLGREEETKNTANFRIENLEAEMHRKEEEARDNVLGLEELIRKTLNRDNYDKLKAFIDNQLQKMAKLRGEISKIRLVLIQRQHTLATLIEKSNALDNLGEDLHMHDFEHLQTETLALGKKIEERNSDLNKLRTRCNADLHVMAHLKEKQQMMRNTIAVQEGALQEFIEEKQQCREALYNLKVERGKIRNEIHELSFQGGLIDKPALMLDYDETLERLVKLRTKVEGMRQKHSDLQHRIHELEENCKEDELAYENEET